MTFPKRPSSRMKAEGFEPVVETSADNFQAWLNHGQLLDASTSTRAAKQPAKRFGGDPSSADWRHFGRLAGFTNPKRERQLPSGMRPFARLRSARGRIYSKAGSLSPASDHAPTNKKDRVVSHRNCGGMRGTLELYHLKNSIEPRPMAAIFTAPPWHGRNTLPVAA
jgi:hypothetical protein